MKFKHLLISSVLLSTTALLADNLVLNGDSAIENKKDNTITFKGNAKATNGLNSIKADKISYNKKSKKIEASGNIIFKKDKLNSTTKADYLRTNKKFSSAYVKNASQVVNGSVRVYSKTLLLKENNDVIATDASYTSCKAPNNEQPTWLLRSGKIVRNDNQQIIKFSNTWMKLQGVPIYYWPYMEQPDANVKALSGWLIPTIGTNSNSGVYVSNSYYKYISPNEDMTISPSVTSKGDQTIEVEHRKNFKDKIIRTNASITKTSNNNKLYQGYVISSYKKNGSNNWSYGGNLEITNKRNYIKQYPYLKKETKDFLKTNIYAQKSTTSSILNIETASYYDVRKSSTPDATVLPKISYFAQYYSNSKNSFYNISSIIKRFKVKDISKMDAVSTTLSYKIPHTLNNGIIIENSLNLRGDFYNYEYTKELQVNGKTYTNGKHNRLVPSLNIIGSYPLLATNSNSSYIIEPLIGLFISTSKKNPDFLPNNDSVDFELDETNLFSNNRYAGVDKIDSGKRLAYGARVKSWQGVNYLQAFFGQSITRDLKNTYSDYIGNLLMKRNNFRVSSNFQLDSKSFTIHKLEASTAYSQDRLTVDASYTKINPRENSNLKTFSQFKSSAIYKINQNWRTSGEFTYEFKGENKGILRQSIGFTYATDCACLETQFKYTRDYSKNKVKPEEYIMLRLIFKSLGQINTSNMLGK